MIAWTTDSGTHELPRWRRGVPLEQQPTQELFLPLRPDISTPRRWSRFARFLTVLITVDVVGTAYVFVTTR